MEALRIESRRALASAGALNVVIPEARIERSGPLLFPGRTWKTADLVLGLFGAKEDRLHFDAANFSWFAVFYPGGQMRVGLLG